MNPSDWRGFLSYSKRQAERIVKVCVEDLPTQTTIRKRCAKMAVLNVSVLPIFIYVTSTFAKLIY